MTRLEEVMQRIGSRPALIRLASAGDFFGENAPYHIEDGVAIIDVVGPLSNAAWSWRGSTYGEIQNQLKIASADPNVRGILLNVNSPGGETDNAFETADVIAALDKPCFAVANTMAYSAAYLLASQADQIYCVPTSGGAGSIGVYCAHFDYSQMLKQEGVAVTLISAGTGKTDGNPYEPLSDSARENLQTEIDRLYGEFVAAVSRGRGVSPTDVVKMGARCFEGATNAIAAGLADMPGDLSTAWVDLCTQIQRPSPMPMVRKGSAASAASSPKEGNSMPGETNPGSAEQPKVPTAAEIEAMVAQAKAEGFGEAAQIVELCEIAGTPVKAAGFISARKPVAEVRAELLKARVEGQQNTELNTSVMPGQSAAGAGQPAEGKARPWREVLQSMGFIKGAK